ncbi:MAG: hypothetical protein M3394_06650, partial [Actinomycetota bacterium]|nr:hypothetical protein [Actinomycetota bacterium]
MATYVVRVWVPDRPGALGAVASRIGAVRGDLVGIDILERGGGRAIDELVVQLPDDEGLVPLLVTEVSQVDGVDVEDVRPLRAMVDSRLDALETAALLVEQETAPALRATLAAHACHDFEADWAVLVVGEEAPDVVGEAPSAAWVRAFVEGSRNSAVVAAGDTGPDDVAWAVLEDAGGSLVVGRRGRPFRARERRQLTA